MRYFGTFGLRRKKKSPPLLVPKPTLIKTTLLQQCRDNEHVDCPGLFKSWVSGNIISCVCTCHKIK